MEATKEWQMGMGMGMGGKGAATFHCKPYSSTLAQVLLCCGGLFNAV